MRNVSLACVLACTAQAFGFPPSVMRRPARSRDEAPARQAAWLLARELTVFDLGTIGRITGAGAGDVQAVETGIAIAAHRYHHDGNYAEMVDAARMAARALASSSIAHRLGDRDVIADAERICANPQRETLLASGDTIVGLAARVLALEAVAGATFQLLLKVDEFAALDPAYSAADRIAARALRPEIARITDTLSGALAALGYSQEDIHASSEEETHSDGDRPAGAAVA